MNNEYMEEMVVLINRMKEIVERDPSVTIRICSAVSFLEATIMDHLENRIDQMSKRPRASNIAGDC